MTWFIASVKFVMELAVITRRSRIYRGRERAFPNSPQYILMSEMSIGLRVLICSRTLLNKYHQFVK